MTSEILLDTNVFLRLLVLEDPALTKRARRLIKKIKDKKLRAHVAQIVIFEIHYALVKYYGFEKNRVIESIESVISANYLVVESKAYFGKALSIYKENNIEFVDSFLLAKSIVDGNKLLTLDKKLDKLYKKSLV